MKKFAAAVFTFLFLNGPAFATAKHFWRGDTMSAKQAEKKWGTSPFDAEKFKNSRENRAKMTASALRSKSLIGKDRVQIREALGAHDGYYFTDMYPAYIVSDESKTGGDTWQLVYLLDGDYKVKEVILHKNCCDK
jgi:hypothetical protein